MGKFHIRKPYSGLQLVMAAFVLLSPAALHGAAAQQQLLPSPPNATSGECSTYDSCALRFRLLVAVCARARIGKRGCYVTTRCPPPLNKVPVGLNQSAAAIMAADSTAPSVEGFNGTNTAASPASAAVAYNTTAIISTAAVNATSTTVAAPVA